MRIHSLPLRQKEVAHLNVTIYCIRRSGENVAKRLNE